MTKDAARLKIPEGAASYRRAYVEISNICNLACSFCPVVERDKKVMTPDAFARVAASLVGQVEEVCLHLMGEPLGHPQFADFLDVCERYQLPVNLTTNGVLLTGKRCFDVLRPIVRQVNISVHSFEANFGSKDVTAYMERVFHLTRRALEERKDLYVNLRLWDLSDPTILNDTNMLIREALTREFGVSFEGLKINLKQRKNMLLSGRIYAHFDSRFIWPAADLPLRTKRGFCHGLTSHFGIHADGTVVPCCLDKEAVINLGNCHEAPLAEILQSPRAEAMRRGFARGELVEDFCQRCPFIERFDKKAQRLAASRSFA